MTARLRVGVLFGGRSGEHEVSLRSAWRVIRALDPARYEVVPVAIGKDGRWRTGIETLRLLEEAQQALAPMPDHGVEVTAAADPMRHALVPLGGGATVPLDVVFPVLHGTYGEDGTVQGLLELAGIPYVGAGVLASAVGMDKAAMKAIFRDAGIPVCRWLVARPATEDAAGLRARIEADLGYPCFVKPANLGSSVGITKVHGPEELGAALAEAAAYDPKVVVEEAVAAREFECGVLGNETPAASVVGELVPSHEFYDYADKYVEAGARIVIPAPLPAETAAAMQQLAVRAFRAIDCAGLARVDFFLEDGTGRVLVNEINTLPGFTPGSMFPKLWEATGMPFAAVVDRLIALALERHRARAARRLSFTPPQRPVSSARRSSSGSR
ncbi:MAG TPA: D-alanine--D-alanine ligase family protein [Candidatus Binatia bacterium]|nr:D-alanine--D-alanine ligase family protein [Candidatus Binatia bacterium]